MLALALAALLACTGKDPADPSASDAVTVPPATQADPPAETETTPPETTPSPTGTPPLLAELCTGGDDEDADGAVDCADPDCASTCDRDGDGEITKALGGGDCDDLDPAVYPGAPEICNDLDDDCDALVDDRDPDWDPAAGLVQFADLDADGAGGALLQPTCEQRPGTALSGGDCDDTRADVNPLAEEICDAVDDDCDGLVDGEDPSVGAWSMSHYHPDLDGDGFGDPATTTLACAADPHPGLVTNDEDCDDADASVGAPADWYADADGDGSAASPAVELDVCVPVDPTLVRAGGPYDCDDAAPSVHPGAADACDDGLDADCNGWDSCHPATAGVLGSADYELSVAGTYDPGTFGLDLAVGDFTGDGIDDLAATGGYWNWYYGVGRLFLFPGPVLPGARVDTSAAIQLASSDSVASLLGEGDYTGDGIPDLAVASPDAYSLSFVSIYAGPVTAGAGSAGIVLGAAYEGIGEYLVGPTDLDEDGLDEMWVGAEKGDVVHVLEGPIGSGMATAFTIGDLASSAGASIDCPRPAVDDLDGDGLADVAFGARIPDSVFVFSHLPLGVEGSGEAEVELTAEGPGDSLGEQVAAAGDVTGDGIGDLLVSATGFGGGAGAVYLVAGPLHSGSVAAATLRIDGEPGEGFGATLGAAGDLDGDGVREATASAAFGDVRLLDLGATGIVARGDVSRLTLGGHSWGELGYRIVGDRDLDADGAPDLAVSAPYDLVGFDMFGWVGVVYGGS